MLCPICESIDCQPFRTLYDDRYGFRGHYHLLKCSRCGHQFLKEKFDPAQLTDLYSNYYPRSSFDVDSHKVPKEAGGIVGWLIGAKSLVMYWVPRGVKVLDIGCGFGESLGYHKMRGCDVHGVEADQNIQRVADKYGYKVKVGLFNAVDYEPESFDYVTMNQVIEHVTDPLQVLGGIASVLKPGGVAVLSTPNSSGWGARVFGKRWINWHTPYHLQFFTEDSLRIAAEKAGLRLEAVKTVTNSDWLKFQWGHLVTYPTEMGVASEYWTPGKKEGQFKRLTLLMIGAMHRTGIDHLITRLFDAISFGDNFLFTLEKK